VEFLASSLVLLWPTTSSLKVSKVIGGQEGPLLAGHMGAPCRRRGKKPRRCRDEGASAAGCSQQICKKRTR
jgi:hypothetical protein